MKKIEEQNFYELLSVKPTATQKEIENAYVYGVASFHPDSLATYGLLSDDEKKLALTRIEEAYKILSSPEKRRRYDLKLRELKNRYKEKAYFRKTTARLEIADGEKIKKSFREKIRKLFSLFRSKKNPEPGEREKIRKAKESLENNNLFYPGEYLKKVREARGLSLEEIANRSKVNVSLLRALEEENYSELPQGIYTPNLLKLYAQQLGLNPED